MPATPSESAPASIRTSITCTKCGKAATVPFTPTPGRPVFCRDCFASAPQPSRSSRPPPRGAPFERPQRASEPRKRMLAQGRKTHFIYDANAALVALPGGMDEKNQRAFLEGLFARGSRISTGAAQEFLEEKLKAELITPQQRDALGNLLERYSFWR